MKRFIFLAGLALTLFLTSCGTKNEPLMSSKDITVSSDNWERITAGTDGVEYLQCEKDVSIISKRACKQGAVLVYRIDGDWHEQIPSSALSEESGNPEPGIAITCIFRTGKAIFRYSEDGFDYLDKSSYPTLKFRIVVFE